ncbi:hypothetical protein GAO09_01015 [Rhizobiales bacterium RZME27]|uniref:GNAT family N-acetyltransferase n=1 Tax=Endobacterium cereale TaxID=2663029 RepID=A0A6A8A1W3_9HYPH|nr:hypothetical protein [Endobacterium cereale]MEB2844736.1 hypothetical protein [Endobacterium cereale]MQY44653.1 hypothetical protein [Endobacterium cereale]
MSGQTTVIRDFEKGDIEGVAGMFQHTFRGVAGSGKAVPQSLIASIEQSFFRHPWNEPDLHSKVAVDEAGRVCGFIGVTPARLEFEGRSLLAAFAGSMMVDDPKANPLIGARLLRAFLAGPQDISLTETANHTALGMWQKLGHPLDPAYSLNWMCVLRPASTAVQLMERRVTAARLIRPVGRIADRSIAVLRRPSFGNGEARRLEFRDVTAGEFGQALLALKDVYPMRPQWDAGNIDWFIRQAEQKRSFGYPEWRVAYGPDGRPAAAYVYFAKAGGIGWVLQALSMPARTGEMVEDMFAHAYNYGCASVRGAAHPWLTPALLQRKAVFLGRSFYVAHAKDKSLLEPIKAGQALISGIAGERWMPLVGDTFDD